MAPSALVALAVVTVPTWACLLCFTTYSERLRVCQFFVGPKGPAGTKCEDDFEAAFKGLRDMEINYEERSRLHDIFTQMTHRLQEVATTQKSYKEAFRNAAESMKDEIAQLKEESKVQIRPRPLESKVQIRPRPLRERAGLATLPREYARARDCIPPCGIQEVSRRFYCRGCYSALCNLSLDCPGEGQGLKNHWTAQDIKVIRGEQALFSCKVKFELPEDITYTWKFVGGVSGVGVPEKKTWSLDSGLRTQDQTYFRELPGARGNVARIRPAQPQHLGTFSCEIAHEDYPLARLYFFLNGSGGAGRCRVGRGFPGAELRQADVRAPAVTGPPPRGETKLQVTFREVLRWAPREVEEVEPWNPSLAELLGTPGALTPSNRRLLAASAAFLSAFLTLLGWMFFRWYFSGS
ncbi:sperm acrosome membrane-associated protein 6 [Rhynchocyon petersi]